MTIRTIKFVGPPLATVILSAGIGMWRSARAQQPSNVDEIDIPRLWVAFRADVTKRSPDGSTVVGQFYRSVDGSSRLETGPSHEQMRVISIKNVPSSKYYLFTDVTGWEMDPMRLPANGYKPPRVKLPSASFAKYEFKVALARGQNGSLQSTQGFEHTGE